MANFGDKLKELFSNTWCTVTAIALFSYTLQNLEMKSTLLLFAIIGGFFFGFAGIRQANLRWRWAIPWGIFIVVFTVLLLNNWRIDHLDQFLAETHIQ